MSSSGESRPDLDAIRAARAEVAHTGVERARQPRVDLVGEHPGQVIGRYELVQKLGEGGFGTVWKAEQAEPVRRTVALKVLKPGMDTREVVSRFEAERQALALMNHPNIARVLDGGATEAGRPYFVMELVDGVPITEYCDRTLMGLRRRLEMFAQVCRAVQHAHTKGVVHRDIKPTNVLVAEEEGEGGRTVAVSKVIDFGIAKATSGELSKRTLITRQMQTIGTPEYMAPEQAGLLDGDIDTRADVYSLGVLLYELLTGTLPFDFESALALGYEEVLRTIREKEPAKPSTRISELSGPSSGIAERRLLKPRQLSTLLRGDLDWIVLKALEKNRNRRYGTASELANDVERHLANEPVLASPPSRTYRLSKLVRRHRSAFVAGGVLLLVLLGGVVGTTSGLVQAKRANASLDAALSTARSETERAERELERANEIKRLVSEMLASVDPEVARTADITLLKEILDRTAERLTESGIRDALVAAELHLVVGEAYASLGLYDDAQGHLPRALELRSSELGEDDPRSLEAEAALAGLLFHLGRLSEAEELFEHVLEVLRRDRGETHHEALHAQSQLARLHRRLGRYAESERLLEGVLTATEGVAGVSVAAARDEAREQLGALYHEQGRYAEAEPIYRRALEERRSRLGEDHPETPRAMNALANLLTLLNRHAEAEELFLEALENQRAVLGPDPKACVPGPWRPRRPGPGVQAGRTGRPGRVARGRRRAPVQRWPAPHWSGWSPRWWTPSARPRHQRETSPRCGA